MRRRRVIWLFAAAIVVVVIGWAAMPYVRSAAFILDIGGSTHWARRLLPVSSQDVRTHDVEIPTRGGLIKARVYQPVSNATSSIAVFPGIHNGDVNEPRLAAFSRRLASTGSIVLSVPLPDLRIYRITPLSTDVIEDVALWMAADRDLAPTGKIGLAGISFAGGLALVAAGRPSLRDIVPMVVSLGGHANLPRTMAYLCDGRLPDGTYRAPHEYGGAVILLAAVDRLVPADQAVGLRHAVFMYLEASGFTQTDPARAKDLFAAVAREAEALPEPSRALMQKVITHQMTTLGPLLAPYIEELGGFPALSPDRSPATHARVFLLHGSDDNVIPSTETPLAADYLRRNGNTTVDLLMTPLLSHANVRSASFSDSWNLVSFWKRLLDTRGLLR